ncbi:MAG: c-type cytochrome [Trichloromonadaceae bacterium]
MLTWTVALCAAFTLLLGCSREESLTPAPPAAVAEPSTAGFADPIKNLELGEFHYRHSCASCHDTGAGGAPLLGDQRNWEARIDQGLQTLVDHAIEGFKSSACVMPPRGGDPGLGIDAVALAVRYMVEKGLPPEAQVPPAHQSN